jgi:hypothetical protein
VGRCLVRLGRARQCPTATKTISTRSVGFCVAAAANGSARNRLGSFSLFCSFIITFGVARFLFAFFARPCVGLGKQHKCALDRRQSFGPSVDSGVDEVVGFGEGAAALRVSSAGHTMLRLVGTADALVAGGGQARATGTTW